jgi:hypothetical protein
MAISIGTLYSTATTGATTLNVTATAAGDLWLVWIVVGSSSITVQSLSAGLASNWVNVGSWLDGSNINESLWIGTQTGSGADTITVNFSGSVSGVGVNIDAHPAHSTLGAVAQWTVAGFATGVNATGALVNFPSLTNGGTNPELYWGHARVPGSAGGPSAGFTSVNDVNGNPVIYNTAVMGTASPTLTPAPTGTYQTFGVLISELGPTQLPVKQSNTQAGTASACTFTLGATPTVGDLMVAVLAVDTPTTPHAPTIFTTNIVDTWVPVLGMQDTQIHDDGNGLRMHVFYKTANATDATQTQFTFNLPSLTDLSQGGLPQFPTTDFAGILLVFTGLNYVGFDVGSPQNQPPNGNQKTFQLPSINTKGVADTFLSAIATLGQPTVGHTDPSASSLASVANTTPAYLSQAFTLALWTSGSQATKYPFAFTTNNPNQFGDVLTATLGIRGASNFYYNGPFARMGYIYEGADQRLLLRYPYHWAYTTLITGSQLLIGQTFSQDQLAAADRYYMSKTLLNPASDFQLILNAGIGGDFNPV